MLMPIMPIRIAAAANNTARLVCRQVAGDRAGRTVDRLSALCRDVARVEAHSVVHIAVLGSFDELKEHAETMRKMLDGACRPCEFLDQFAGFYRSDRHHVLVGEQTVESQFASLAEEKPAQSQPAYFGIRPSKPGLDSPD
ncbi:hypothetical protein [Lacisediminimonas sp.]|uniref:hypothetical protein n=1 Tax=Lacisediminimonas sp. TaxID=3060582 RepID=UPI00271A04DD|nr:hypothetical protein [Lacisediminimonas sp.]MDO8299313.1 hypothetical protein [Lacisediminimonas sp.]